MNITAYKFVVGKIKERAHLEDMWFKVVPGGGGSNTSPPTPKFRRPFRIVPTSTLLWKLLKIAEFRMLTPQDVRKKGSKIKKLPRFAIVLH